MEKKDNSDHYVCYKKRHIKCLFSRSEKCDESEKKTNSNWCERSKKLEDCSDKSHKSSDESSYEFKSSDDDSDINSYDDSSEKKDNDAKSSSDESSEKNDCDTKTSSDDSIHDYKSENEDINESKSSSKNVLKFSHNKMR